MKNDKFSTLRKNFPTFYYHSFYWDINENAISIDYHFSIEDKFHFKPKSIIVLPKYLTVNSIDRLVIDYVFFYIGMIEAISYWKTTCSPFFVVKPYSICDNQVKWWKKLWYFGLGEFFWRNFINVSEQDFVSVVFESKTIIEPIDVNVNSYFYLVPIGGGKDSIVTIEILKKYTNNIIPFMINPNRSMWNTVRASGVKLEPIVVNRSIDNQLLEMNNRGFLNGHTPFSALVAFYSLSVAVLQGLKYIAVSHEASASESTVINTPINHQYSKTYLFESDFRNFTKQYISSSIEYFSLLRPLLELQIAQLFSNFKQYHSIFRSCNVGSKDDRWCGECPKCLFTALILLPFLRYDEIITIFQKDILNNQSLLYILKQLVGLADEKPFECVGTIDEIRTALNYSITNWTHDSLPFLLFWYKNQTIFISTNRDSFNQLLLSPHSDHFLQSDLYEHVLSFLQQSN